MLTSELGLKCGAQARRDLDLIGSTPQRAWSDRSPFFRLVSVRTGALEFVKATVVASDLTTGEPTSNRRFTTLQRRRAEAFHSRVRPCPLGIKAFNGRRCRPVRLPNSPDLRSLPVARSIARLRLLIIVRGDQTVQWASLPSGPPSEFARSPLAPRGPFYC